MYMYNPAYAPNIPYENITLFRDFLYEEITPANPMYCVHVHVHV